MIKLKSIIVACAFTGFLVVHSGCGTAPIHGTFLSDEKNMWIEEAGGVGVSYCVSQGDASKPDPVCYPARRALSGEKTVEKTSSVIPSSTPAAANKVLTN